MKQEQELYKHIVTGKAWTGRSRHLKWDDPGQGEHEAYCKQCKRIVQWQSTGKKR